MNRQEFKQMAHEHYSGMTDIISNDEDPFWTPEVRDGWKASYFAVCRVSVEEPDKYFWVQCKEHMTKVPLCYMFDSDHKKEWWGFNTEEDMTWFLMRWCG